MNENRGTNLLAFVGGILVWAAFGPKIKRTLSNSKALQALKAEVDEEVSKIKDITQNRYNEIVDQISDKYGKLKGISKNELQDLIADLKDNWFRIKTAWNRDSGLDQF
ncbi:MAG TPA: hypothetical protein VGQ87_03125 [Patescibacteria group bacterium]|jgi:hypothetical protein|nr:hypothetical protein [Patescibacteria group bacterium]